MRKSKFTEEQIIGILREQEAGAVVTELCRRAAPRLMDLGGSAPNPAQLS